jgi:hypothetical protein
VANLDSSRSHDFTISKKNDWRFMEARSPNGALASITQRSQDLGSAGVRNWTLFGVRL